MERNTQYLDACSKMGLLVPYVLAAEIMGCKRGNISYLVEKGLLPALEIDSRWYVSVGEVAKLAGESWTVAVVVDKGGKVEDE